MGGEGRRGVGVREGGMGVMGGEGWGLWEGRG